MTVSPRDFCFFNPNVCRLVGKLKVVSCSLLIMSSLMITLTLLPVVFTQEETGNGTLASCNCIVFRLDDVQDSFVDPAQLATMNIFVSKGQPLSLALIMNNTGNDSRIVDKITEGSQMGLFELGIHGWDHVDYTRLSDSDQKKTLDMANTKIKRIFGQISEIFVPPYGYFNIDTLKAVNEQGIRILSATLSSENNFDKGGSIFNNSKEMARNVSGISHRTNENIEVPLPFHVPGLVSYKDYENGRLIKNPVSNIIESVDANIKKYGYSVIILHPQDFVPLGTNGKIIEKNRLNSTEINELSRLIDTVLSKNKRITTLSEIVASTAGNR